MVVGQNFNQVLLLVGIQQGQQTQSISIQSVMVKKKTNKKTKNTIRKTFKVSLNIKSKNEHNTKLYLFFLEHNLKLKHVTN